MSLSTASRLGPYEVIGPIGAGGMGEVYKARDTRLHRDVAIKILPESFAADADRLRRFQMEAQSAGALNHPNILAIYDVGTYEGIPYLVSELLEGESLSDRLKRGKLGINRAIEYGRQIAAGLAAAHAKGITHRDIKPGNIYLAKDGRVKILDFGLAKMTGAKPDEHTATIAVTNAGMVMGTAAYMSPEQARGHAVDQRSDIFSFGCVLYETVTGIQPFNGDTTADLMGAILKDDPDWSAIPSPGLQRLIAHCLEKNPEQRFQSAQDIAFDLESITQQHSGPKPVTPGTKRGAVPWLLGVIAILASVCAALVYVASRPGSLKTFQRLTFRRGIIHAARFTPDGNGVVYSAKWEDEPSEVFTERLDAPGSRALGFSGAVLRSISPSGFLALAEDTHISSNAFAPGGLLVQAPFSGGAPRPLENKIDFAEWAPNGSDLALVREGEFGTQLEFPPGKVLYRTAGYISEPRFSPDGARIAFLDHPSSNDNAGSVVAIDRLGKMTKLTSKYIATQGLAWSPKGNEVWFTATRSGARLDLRAVTLGGRERVLLSAPTSIVLRDVAKDGRVLITNEEVRMKLLYHAAGDQRERELSWLDWSLISSLSPDGKYVAFFESGEGAGTAQLAYLRETSGAPAVLLGNGIFPILSPDGQSVVVFENDPSAIMAYPIGPGQAKRIQLPSFTLSIAGLMPDGKHIWFNGNEGSHGRRYYMTDLEGGKPRALSPEGVRSSLPGLVLNGKYVTGITEGKFGLYPVDGGEPEIPSGIRKGEGIAGSSEDGQALFIDAREIPAKVYRLDRKTQSRDLLLEITPADRAGIAEADGLMVAPDGKTYAYSVQQQLSDLQLVQGIK